MQTVHWNTSNILPASDNVAELIKFQPHLEVSRALFREWRVRYSGELIRNRLRAEEGTCFHTCVW